MAQLVLKRTLLAIPTLLVVSMLVFWLLFVGPNPLEQLQQDPNFTAEDVERLTKLYGWDKPVPVQYVDWVTGFVTGDWGESIQQQKPARDIILERLPLTLIITGSAMILSLLIAIPLGVFTAVKKYSKADYTATTLTFAMMAAPSFFIALLLQLFALKLGDWNNGNLILYTGGAPRDWGSPAEVIGRLFLPIFALSILQIAGWSRYQRSQLLTVLESDYIRSALAKGLSFRTVLTRHAMRNTMLPIITIVAIDLAVLFSGAVITESVFALPGMGTLLLDSVLNRDVVVAVDIIMIAAFLMVFFNALADVTYGLLDPRVRVK